jgi:2-polyprenyl-3-methyl-5-hydroxy-6-metoxy-1,4-benzoquinol methylase
MSLAEEYRRQLAWRSWAIILDALPLLPGHKVLDLGCAVGDQAAELAARGARVLGVDLDEELLQAARGHDYEQVRSDFLGCLARDDHRCDAKVVCCIAIRR